MSEPTSGPAAHPPRHDRIAPTAHFTAYVWRRIGMPYGHLFATRTGASLFWALRVLFETPHGLLSRDAHTLEAYLAQRHRMIEHLMAEREPDRVIELAAGLSRRGTTWALDHDLPYVEVDLPGMVATKEALVAARAPELRAPLAGRLERVACDLLSPRLTELLDEKLAGATRPVVIAEGLMGYLARAERGRLASTVAQALSRHGDGGVFIVDVEELSAQRGRLGGGRRAFRALIQVVTRGQGVRDPFIDRADCERFYRSHGFARIERFTPSDLVAHIPRLPRAETPLNVYRLGVGAGR